MSFRKNVVVRNQYIEKKLKSIVGPEEDKSLNKLNEVTLKKKLKDGESYLTLKSSSSSHKISSSKKESNIFFIY